MILDAGVEVEIREPDHESPDEGDTQIIIDTKNDAVRGGWRYFDTAANAHVTGNAEYYVAFTEDTSNSQSVHGVAPALTSRIAGVGTVAFVTEVDGERGVVYLEDVVYVPGAEHGLLSPGLAIEQGFYFDYERTTMNFRISNERPGGNGRGSV
ncbi:hypothetical protein PHMEG_00039933 [Phytophthora megakarya]|uniref:Retrovirus-related Pol polyprotein from transposon TNT 1-94-like beta-barrel domain-containing protein n=1 Tax=Phytophthora megakarya TaxID=4795 RepID=A0A225UE20_9STRA|nr:hypothetical protein PHMEG_00039933 [Phytophthora megakarya]